MITDTQVLLGWNTQRRGGTEATVWQQPMTSRDVQLQKTRASKYLLQLPSHAFQLSVSTYLRCTLNLWQKPLIWSGNTTTQQTKLIGQWRLHQLFWYYLVYNCRLSRSVWGSCCCWHLPLLPVEGRRIPAETETVSDWTVGEHWPKRQHLRRQ